MADDPNNLTRLQQLEAEIRAAERQEALERRKQQVLLKNNQQLAEYARLLLQERELQVLVNEGAAEYQETLDTLIARKAEMGATIAATEKASLDLFHANQKSIKQAAEHAEKKKKEKEAVQELNQATTNALELASRFLGIQGKLARNSTQFTKTVLEQGHAFDELRASLAVTTGYAHRFEAQMIDLANNNSLQLSMTESNQVIGALSLSFLEFNAMSEDAQRATNALAGEFLRLGVAPEQTAQGLHLLTRGFGLATENALSTLDAMKRLADESGQSLSKVMGALTKVGPQLARYGQSSEVMFNKLIKTARQFGMEAESAFGLSEMFDTYESAFSVAGRLNAQFRTQINAMEIMGILDPAERLRRFREELVATGLSAETMGVRERQMLAKIMQTSEAEIMALMQDPMEAYNLQKAEQDRLDNLERFTSAQKKMAESFEKMYISLTPLTTMVMDMITAFSNVLNPLVDSLTGKVALLAIFAKGVAMPFYLLGKAATKVAQLTGKVSALGGALLKVVKPLQVIVGALATIAAFQKGGTGEAFRTGGGLLAGLGGGALATRLPWLRTIAGASPWGRILVSGLGFAAGSGLFDFMTKGWMNDGIAGPGVYMPHGDWSKAVRVPAGDQIRRDDDTGMTVFDYGGLARKERDKRLAQQSLKQKIELNLPEIVLYLSPDGKKEIGRLGAQSVKGIISPDRIVRA